MIFTVLVCQEIQTNFLILFSYEAQNFFLYPKNKNKDLITIDQTNDMSNLTNDQSNDGEYFFLLNGNIILWKKLTYNSLGAFCMVFN